MTTHDTLQLALKDIERLNLELTEKHRYIMALLNSDYNKHVLDLLRQCSKHISMALSANGTTVNMQLDKFKLLWEINEFLDGRNDKQPTLTNDEEPTGALTNSGDADDINYHALDELEQIKELKCEITRLQQVNDTLRKGREEMIKDINDMHMPTRDYGNPPLLDEQLESRYREGFNNGITKVLGRIDKYIKS
jgi:hypothetical protein